MSRACCAGGCSSYASKKDDGVSFHYFPRDSMLRTEWIRRVSHGRKNWTYWKSSRLCSRHFTPDSFFTGFHCHKHLKPDSVPTLFCTDVSEVEVAVEEPSSRKRHAGDDINWLDEVRTFEHITSSVFETIACHCHFRRQQLLLKAQVHVNCLRLWALAGRIVE